ncbi:MAG: hypothetical protein H8E46_05700 [FCB group bacterium]|nr:hypothetical protein [FCB group bacterium]
MKRSINPLAVFTLLLFINAGSGQTTDLHPKNIDRFVEAKHKQLEVTLTITGEPLPADTPVGDFFPVGYFDADEMSDFTHLQGSKINCLHTYNLNWTPDDDRVEKFLDRAHAAGMKTIVTPATIFTHRGNSKNWNKAKRRIERLKNHPGLLAWYLADEPHLLNIPLERIRELHKYIKFTDPLHPTFLVEDDPAWKKMDYYPRLPGAVDIIGAEPYLRGKRPLTYIYDYIQMVRKLLPGYPVWMLVEAHALEEFSYFPTAREIRAQTYEALIDGASAILFYGFDGKIQEGKQIIERPEQFEEILKLAAEIDELKHAWQSPYLPLAEIPKELNISLRKTGDEYWLVILNREPAPLAAKFIVTAGVLSELKWHDYINDLAGYNYQASENMIFVPCEVKIFRLSPN